MYGASNPGAANGANNTVNGTTTMM